MLTSPSSIELQCDDAIVASAPGEDGDGDLARLVESMLRQLGENPGRTGLSQTPARVSRSLRYLTSGYSEKLVDIVGEGIFPEASRGPVVVRCIDFFSLCEHHLLPFFGRMDVGYLPDGRVLGLSKIARVVDMFARRLQTQENLTAQVAEGVSQAVSPIGVAVVAEARHMCMSMRGVQKAEALTRTTAVIGTFDLNAMRA